MLAKRKIKVRIKVNQLVNDIRAGMNDIDLMNRHGLSAKGLESTFKKLVEGKFISQSELDRRSMPFWDTADVQDMRRVERYYPALTVTVRDLRKPGTKGVLHDVSERGIGVRGIVAKPNEVKLLSLNLSELEEIVPFAFEGLCRWGRLDPDRHTYSAGFEINRISDDSLDRLKVLIREATFGD